MEAFEGNFIVYILASANNNFLKSVPTSDNIKQTLKFILKEAMEILISD